MLVFNKKRQYEKLLENGFEAFPNVRDLTILCQQWIKLYNCNDKDLIFRMTDFCNTWSKEFNSAKAETVMLKALKNARTQEDKEFYCPEIRFYEEEVSVLRSIKNREHQKVYFVICCIAKWQEKDSVFLNSKSFVRLEDIFKYCGINTTKVEQRKIIHDLTTSGLLKFELPPITPMLQCRIVNIKNEGNIVHSFTINDDMVLELPNMVGDKCERCGKMFIKAVHNQKYCQNCAKIVKNEQNKGYLKKKLGKQQL